MPFGFPGGPSNRYDRAHASLEEDRIVRELFFKLLPYGTGALIGYVVFFPSETLVELGPLRWLIGAGALFVLSLAAVAAQLAVGLPEHVGISPAQDGARADERALLAQYEALGFAPVGPPLRLELRPAARMQVLAHGAFGCWASVFSTTTLPRRVGHDVFSIVEGERGGLSTLADPNGAVLPTAPGSFKQVFRGATPGELVRRHLEAVAFLTRQGVRFAPPTEADLEGQIRRSMSRQRRAVMSNPLRASAVALWRTLTKRTPHAQPVAEQRVAAPAIRHLRRGAA